MSNKKSRKKIIIPVVILLLLAAAAVVLYVLTTPRITLNGDKTMEVTMADGYKEPGATASFSFRDITKHIEIESHVNDHKVGTYTVTYKVSYLRKTAEETRTVNVVDKEPPVISLAGEGDISIRPGEKFEDPGATAVDDSDGDVSSDISSKGFVDRYNKGEYEITYTVSDSYGNVAESVRKVTVQGEPVRKVKGVIYLTFDDGPSNTVTPEILDTLEKYKVPATFFIIDYGNDEKKMKTIRRAIKDGCTIAIHGMSHDYGQIYDSVPHFMDNITSLKEKVKEDFGYDAFAMRFPGGSSNTVSESYSKGIMTKLVKKVQSEGFMYNDWNVDSTDASGNNIPVSTLVRNVQEECDPDNYNVILMHDSDAKGTTAEALPKIIRWGKKEGYRFRAMSINSPTVHHDVNN